MTESQAALYSTELSVNAYKVVNPWTLLSILVEISQFRLLEELCAVHHCIMLMFQYWAQCAMDEGCVMLVLVSMDAAEWALLVASCWQGWHCGCCGSVAGMEDISA